jgi:coniferyl-aldehyde dehydrogenase
LTLATTSDLSAILATQRAAFRSNPNPPALERKQHLGRLLATVLAHQEDMISAANRDFGCRARQETVFGEIYTTTNAIRHARRHVTGWMRPRRRPVPLTLQPGRAWIQPQPVGVAGIISPWNFPVNLSLIPLVAGLAAGNRVMLKPSEYTPATSDLLARLIAGTFDCDHVAVITGEADVGRAFSQLPFDHLLFTGSTAVGREIMRVASNNLTPVTLELGGKSPALVAPGADIAAAAASIAYGKLMNAGQICIAPDYALVPRGQLELFCEEFSRSARRYYPSGIQSSEYTSIINDRHHHRLTGYITEARARGVKVMWPLGEASADGRKFAPALLIDPPDDLAVMQDEVFGPLLPIQTYGDLAEAIDFVNGHPRPLALYLFARDKQSIDRVIERTTSGGVCINDALTHFAVDDLPFGGMGASGMGRYHGRDGFDAFSHNKPVFRTGLWNPAVLFRPPVTEWQKKLGRFLIGHKL